MPFNQREVEELLAATGRLCCICNLLTHNMVIHHIVPLKDGGSDYIDNAIALCQHCHEEVHKGYVPGRSTRAYTPRELKLQRERTIAGAQGKQWVPEASTLLETLIQFRKNGVALRNAGLPPLLEEAQLPQWIADYRNWQESVIQVLNQYDTREADYFALLDLFYPWHSLEQCLNSKHLRYLNNFSEKLQRLGIIIGRFPT